MAQITNGVDAYGRSIETSDRQAETIDIFNLEERYYYLPNMVKLLLNHLHDSTFDNSVLCERFVSTFCDLHKTNADFLRDINSRFDTLTEATLPLLQHSLEHDKFKKKTTFLIGYLVQNHSGNQDRIGEMPTILELLQAKRFHENLSVRRDVASAIIYLVQGHQENQKAAGVAVILDVVERFLFDGDPSVHSVMPPVKSTKNKRGFLYFEGLLFSFSIHKDLHGLSGCFES